MKYSNSGIFLAVYAVSLYLASPVSPAYSQVTQINNPPVPGADVQEYLLNPSGSRVVYRGDLLIDGADDLYSASTASSGTQIRISTPLAGGEVSSEFLLSADGSRAIYSGDLTTVGVEEIYSASTTATGTQIRINSTPIVGGGLSDFTVTPDGSRAVYSGFLTTPGVRELYSASTTATGTQIKINDTPVAGGIVAFGVQVTSDGSRAVYTGDLTTDGVPEIYSASTTATGTQIKLNDTPVAGGIVFGGARLTSDGSRAVYRGDLTTVGVTELYSASTTATGTQIKISNTPVAGGDVSSNIQLTSDGSRALYTGDLTTNTVTELYSASTTASDTQIKLNDTPVAGGNVLAFETTADGSRAVYRGDLSTDGTNELYSASTTATGTQIKLNDTPVSGGLVSNSLLSPDGSRVVYVGDLDTVGVFELYSASTTFSDTQIKLNDDFAVGDGIGDYAISDDGIWVAFEATTNNERGLFLTKADGSIEAQEIDLDSSVPLIDVNIRDLAFLPGTNEMIFRADLNINGDNELYSTIPEASTGTLILISSVGLLARRRRS